MKRSIVVGAGLLAAGLCLSPSPAAGQATIGWDAAVLNAYVWRGVTYTNKPVFQPDVWVSIPVSTASVTVGGWANIDIGKYDGATDLVESGGTSAFNFAEFDYWAEIGVPAGIATLTAGVTGYFFPNPQSSGGFWSTFNTTEIYGKVALGVPLSPKLAVWYDVDKVKGAYFEGSVAHSVPLGAASLNLGLLAGLSAGQGVKAGEFANFAKNDITHVDLSASIPFSAGPLTIAPSAHAVWLNDDFTKFTNAANSKDFKAWFCITISWSHDLGGGGEEAEEGGEGEATE